MRPSGAGGFALGCWPSSWGCRSSLPLALDQAGLSAQQVRGGGPAAKATWRQGQERGRCPSLGPWGLLSTQPPSNAPPSLGSPVPTAQLVQGKPCSLTSSLSERQSCERHLDRGHFLSLLFHKFFSGTILSLSPHRPCSGGCQPISVLVPLVPSPQPQSGDPGARARLPYPWVPGWSFCVPPPLLPRELLRAAFHHGLLCPGLLFWSHGSCRWGKCKGINALPPPAAFLPCGPWGVPYSGSSSFCCRTTLRLPLGGAVEVGVPHFRCFPFLASRPHSLPGLPFPELVLETLFLSLFLGVSSRDSVKASPAVLLASSSAPPLGLGHIPVWSHGHTWVQAVPVAPAPFTVSLPGTVHLWLPPHDFPLLRAVLGS